jgi:hypothetical protein
VISAGESSKRIGTAAPGLLLDYGWGQTRWPHACKEDHHDHKKSNYPAADAWLGTLHS